MNPEKLEFLSRLVARQPSLNVNGLLNTVLAQMEDQRLSPLERSAWLAIRVHITENGDQASFSYEQLRPYLRCMPNAAQASLETVARTLIVLRLTRWIHLTDQQRDPKTGRIMQNDYRIHAAPLPFLAVCESDSGYLDLLDKAFTHASQTVRQVAQIILAEVATDPQQIACLPASLRARLVPDNGSGSGSEGSGSPPLAGGNEKKSVSSSSKTAGKHHPKTGAATVRTVRSSNKYKERTTYSAPAHENHTEGGITDLRLPDCFERLEYPQQCEALTDLQRVRIELQQAVLDEWSARCQQGGIRQPAGYLFALIRRAKNGQFRPYAATRISPDAPVAAPQTLLATPAHSAPEKPSLSEHKPASREVAQSHLANIRQMLGKRPQLVGELAAQMMAQGAFTWEVRA
ncbi:STY4528 family pathogenicity island replication protein [Serratia fonticola]|uniref:STY4528 family pathogenicity island replication protein n=1 Tax=Serratia fonticola TaxID=47917 RepID=UPI00217C2440|nr:STY4528 family pathogenicity island replication protein [Serratia fonticola]CAI1728025.1 Uncharacterised protein [Serratia fonticola]